MTNYFDFFELPVSPKVDQGELRKRFLTNSKRFHPDFHTLEGEDKQAEVLELSTLNNQAYRVLKDDDQRLRHFLTVKGVLAEEGQNSVPQDFLMEMMDVNEQLMELEFDPDPALVTQAKTSVVQLEQRLWQSVATIVEGYQTESATEAELQALKDYYLKKRYLLRIHENLAKFAAH